MENSSTHLKQLLDYPSFSILQDIYDGQLWKDFQHLNGQPCLASRFAYIVMLNVNWFQPYKLTQSSVGAIILNYYELTIAGA